MNILIRKYELKSPSGELAVIGFSGQPALFVLFDGIRRGYLCVNRYYR
jgi:hypothetical protein